MRRTQPSTKGQISSTAHVQLLQWLHGKQQQHEYSRDKTGQNCDIFTKLHLQYIFEKRFQYLEEDQISC